MRDSAFSSHTLPAESSPSLSNRRRWLIAGVTLAVAAFLIWWIWPRGDERFVGKWQWEQTVLDLHDDLSAGVTSSGPIVLPFPIPSRWWVEGKILVVEQFSDGSVRSFVRNLVRRITHPHEPDARRLRFYVEKVEANRLTCRFLGNDGVTPLPMEYVLVRLPRE